MKKIVNIRNQLGCYKIEFFTYDEGDCVQCMHVGPYDEELKTIKLMHDFIEDAGYELDISNNQFHHEIYLSDPRKVDESRLKTVIRHPVKRKKEKNGI